MWPYGIQKSLLGVGRESTLRVRPYQPYSPLLLSITLLYLLTKVGNTNPEPQIPFWRLSVSLYPKVSWRHTSLLLLYFSFSTEPIYIQHRFESDPGSRLNVGIRTRKGSLRLKLRVRRILTRVSRNRGLGETHDPKLYRSHSYLRPMWVVNQNKAKIEDLRLRLDEKET